MQSANSLNTIPDDDLLRRLVDLLRHSRGTEADLVAHIAEVDARRLYAREASPSMYAYCTEVLHLSEGEAYLRIAAARASREHPVLLEMLADGRLHLSAIAKVAPHLTPENREAVLARATHKSKRQVEELLAELEPRPDAPSSVRKLPERRPGSLLSSGELSLGGAVVDECQVRPGQGVSAMLELGPGKDTSAGSGGLAASESEPFPADAAQPDVQVFRAGSGTSHRALIEPLAPARYKVQFTASAELRDKLERLRALMHSSVPDGDLGAIIETAVTEKLERLEARRFGRMRARRRGPAEQGVTGGRGAWVSPRGRLLPQPGKRPSSTGSSSRRTRHVPASVRRAVYERDGGQCRFVDEQGRRCPAREGLEFHHRLPFGFGGEHSVEQISLMCGTHNRYLAEVDYGEEAMARHARSRKRPLAPLLGPSS